MTAKAKPSRLAILGKEPPPAPAPAPVAAQSFAPVKADAVKLPRCSFNLSHEAAAQLKILSAELTRNLRRPVSQQDIIQAGLDIIFARHGKPQIAGGPSDLVE